MPISLFETQNGTSIVGDVSNLTENLDYLNVQSGVKFSEIQSKQGQILSVQGQISNFQFIINQGPGTFPNLNPNYASALAAIGPAQSQLVGYQGELSILIQDRVLILNDIDALELKIANARASVSVDADTSTLDLNIANNNWKFGANGTLENAGSWTKTTSNYLVSGDNPGVVWTSTNDFISGAKLLIQLEANEIGVFDGWHTQMCEAMIAVRGHQQTSIPVISVYGVTHTSAEPLMTFTVERNPTTNLIEVMGTRTETATPSGNVLLTIYSVETGTND
jgi:hypothetical protein